MFVKTHRMYNTEREPSCELWMTVTCQCRLTAYNGCALCCGIVAAGDAVSGRPGITFSIPCTQFCCEPKTTLRNKDHWKKIRERGKEIEEGKKAVSGPSSTKLQRGKSHAVSRPSTLPFFFFVWCYWLCLFIYLFVCVCSLLFIYFYFTILNTPIAQELYQPVSCL